MESVIASVKQWFSPAEPAPSQEFKDTPSQSFDPPAQAKEKSRDDSMDGLIAALRAVTKDSKKEDEEEESQRLRIVKLRALMKLMNHV